MSFFLVDAFSWYDDVTFERVCTSEAPSEYVMTSSKRDVGAPLERAVVLLREAVSSKPWSFVTETVGLPLRVGAPELGTLSFPWLILKLLLRKCAGSGLRGTRGNEIVDGHREMTLSGPW